MDSQSSVGGESKRGIVNRRVLAIALATTFIVATALVTYVQAMQHHTPWEQIYPPVGHEEDYDMCGDVPCLRVLLKIQHATVNPNFAVVGAKLMVENNWADVINVTWISCQVWDRSPVEIGDRILYAWENRTGIEIAGLDSTMISLNIKVHHWDQLIDDQSVWYHVEMTWLHFGGEYSDWWTGTYNVARQWGDWGWGPGG